MTSLHNAEGAVMDVMFPDCGLGLQIHCVSALGSLRALMSRCFMTLCLIASSL